MSADSVAERDIATPAADPPELWLLRHGETPWTVASRHTGRSDLGLTQDGRAQITRWCGSLEGLRFARVYSSPLRRARETAELLGFAPIFDDRLMEWDYGAYEGRTSADIRVERPGWDLWRDGCPEGEDLDDVAIRLGPLLQELRDQARAGDEKRTPDGGPVRILLIGHGHCLRVLAGCWLGLGALAGRSLQLAPGALSVIGSERGWRAIARWNLAAGDQLPIDPGVAHTKLSPPQRSLSSP